jgi:hypothetical protein
MGASNITYGTFDDNDAQKLRDDMEDIYDPDVTDAIKLYISVSSFLTAAPTKCMACFTLPEARAENSAATEANASIKPEPISRLRPLRAPPLRTSIKARRHRGVAMARGRATL